MNFWQAEHPRFVKYKPTTCSGLTRLDTCTGPSLLVRVSPSSVVSPDMVMLWRSDTKWRPVSDYITLALPSDDLGQTQAGCTRSIDVDAGCIVTHTRGSGSARAARVCVAYLLRKFLKSRDISFEWDLDSLSPDHSRSWQTVTWLYFRDDSWFATRYIIWLSLKEMASFDSR